MGLKNPIYILWINNHLSLVALRSAALCSNARPLNQVGLSLAHLNPPECRAGLLAIKAAERALHQAEVLATKATRQAAIKVVALLGLQVVAVTKVVVAPQVGEVLVVVSAAVVWVTSSIHRNS